MRFAHQGLEVECELTKFVPATWLDPPEPSEVINLTWTVDDIDVVLGWLELGPHETKFALRAFRNEGSLPPHISDLIDSRWDLTEAAYEAAADNPSDE